MPVRTTQLGVLKPVANTFTTLFTVAPGFTDLVKSAFAFNGGGAADTIQVQAVSQGVLSVFVIPNQSLAANAGVSIQTYIVLLPGDSAQLFSLLGTTTFWLSGTKLPGVA